MSEFAGGIADKFGNDYEYTFICFQILDILRDKIKHIKCEPIEFDSRIDLECYLDNKTQLYQCKSNNGNSDKWTTTDLDAHGVIQGALNYISSNKEYHIVSSISSSALKDFLNNVRITNNLNEIVNKSKADFEFFEQFFKIFKKYKQLDKETTYQTLKFLYLDTFTNDMNEVERFIEYHFLGNGKVLVSSLKTFIKDNFNKMICKEDIIKYFHDLGVKQTTFYSSHIVSNIEILKEAFISGMKSTLISNEIIHREETDDCLKKIAEKQILIIHGDSGTGKSGIVYEIIEKLDKKGKYVIPFRLDRLGDLKGVSNELDFSRKIGFENTITNSVVELSRNNEVILIIDQLDAIKTVGLESQTLESICNTIINNILLFNKQVDTNIKIILSCRTYDMKTLPFLNYIIKKYDTCISTQKINVLSDRNIDLIAQKANKQITPQIRSLIKNINNLKMWFYIDKDVTTTNDLIREFLIAKKLEILTKGCTINDIDIVLNHIMQYMDDNLVLSINKNEINHYIAYSYLVSSGILVENSNTSVSFYHQSIYEYLMMKRIDEEVAKESDILQWLKEKKYQTLKKCFRFESYIKLKVQENPDHVYKIMKKIMYNTAVRFIIKNSCINALNLLKENNKDIEQFIIENCDKKPYISMCNRAISGNHILTQAFARSSKLKSMLLSQDEDVTRCVSNILRDGNEYCGKEIIDVLEDIRTNIPNNNDIIKNIMIFIQRRNFNNLDGNIANYIINNFDEYFDMNFIVLEDYLSLNNELFGTMLYKIIQKIIDSEDKTNMRIYIEKKKKNEVLKQVYKKIPIEKLKQIIEMINRIDYESSIYADKVAMWYREGRYDEDKAINTVKSLIIQCGQYHLNNNFNEVIDIFNNKNNMIVNMLACKVFLRTRKEYSDLIIDWMISDKDRYFVINGIFNPYPENTYKLLTVISPMISDKKFKLLEDILYYFKDEKCIKYIKKDYKDICLLNSNYNSYTYYYNRIKYILLCSLDNNRINNNTRELIQVLKRTLGTTPENMFKRYGLSGMNSVKSTLKDNASKLSDKMWLEIMSKDIKESNKYTIRNGFHVISSNEEFSGDFQTCIENDSKRFCKLIIDNSDSIYEEYKVATIDGLLKIYRTENTEIIETILSETTEIIKMFRNISRSYSKVHLANLIGEIIKYRFDEEFIDILNEYAENNLDSEELDYKTNEKETSIKYETIRINSIAGLALESMSKIIKEVEQVSYKTFINIINRYIESREKEKRYFVLPFLFQLYFIDKELSIELFKKCIDSNFEFLIHTYGHALFYNIINFEKDKIKEMIGEISKSENEEVQKLYGILIGSRYIFYNTMEEELLAILKSDNIFQKVGLAIQAVHCVFESKWFDKSSYIILNLIDNQQEEILKEITHVFYRNSENEYTFLNNYSDFLIKILSHKNMIDSMDSFTYTLEEYVDNLCEFSTLIFAVADNLIDNKDSFDKEGTTKDFYYLENFIQLLIRLNEQSMYKDQSTAEQSLEKIDLISENYNINLNSYLKALYH